MSFTATLICPPDWNGIYPGTLLPWAFHYARLCIPIFPCTEGGKRPAIHKARGGSGFKDATTDIFTVNDWWLENPWYNIGMPTGRASGLVGLDIDGDTGKQNFYSLLAKLASLNMYSGDLAALVRVVTPNNGFHLHFSLESGQVVRSRNGLLPGIDVKGEGGYVLLPPSQLRNGHSYRWQTSVDAFPRNVPRVPNWLEATLSASAHANRSTTYRLTPVVRPIWLDPANYIAAIIRRLTEAIVSALNGQQEWTLNRSTFELGRYIDGKTLTFECAFDVLLSAALRMQNFDLKHPWRKDELFQKVERGLRDGMERPILLKQIEFKSRQG